ncbi:MAG: hypothetical protein U9R74_18850 [Pseudomonadota bacterium]|nr:hypothetical protein [Pseudomonadota bacterium]
MNKLFTKPNRSRIRKNAADVSKAIESAESAALEPRYRDVALDAIEMDPDQPRQMALDADDVIRGRVDESDPLIGRKLEELEEIRNLAVTQKAVGELYAPVGYERAGQRVRLIDGHRRYLSRIYKALHIDTVDSLSAVKMACKVYPRKPDAHVIEEIAIIGNIQRKELSLREMLGWAFRRDARNRNEAGESLNAGFFSDTLGLKNSQAAKWARIVSVGQVELQPVMDALESGRNIAFNAAYSACAEPNVRMRKALIEKLAGTGKVRVGAKERSGVSLGRATKLDAIRILIERNMEEDQWVVFEDTDWSDAAAVQKAFGRFIKQWEARHG